MKEERVIKPVVWVGLSHEDLKNFPDDVQEADTRRLTPEG